MDKEMMDLYTDILISSTCQTSCTQLSKMLCKRISHDKFTRFLLIMILAVKNYGPWSN